LRINNESYLFWWQSEKKYDAANIYSCLFQIDFEPMTQHDM
jgi:hypothetical protein